jgi:hypothetical protein
MGADRCKITRPAEMGKAEVYKTAIFIKQYAEVGQYTAYFVTEIS